MNKVHEKYIYKIDASILFYVDSFFVKLRFLSKKTVPYRIYCVKLEF